MKKFLSILLAIVIIAGLFVTIKVTTDDRIETPETTETTENIETFPEIRAVWISYFELTTMNDSDKSETAFRKKADPVLNCCTFVRQFFSPLSSSFFFSFFVLE